MKETLVVIVGAGASLQAGISSTAQLTKLTKQTMPQIIIPGVLSRKLGDPNYQAFPREPYLAEILDQGLRADYGNDYDFERILHALEELETYLDARYNPQGRSDIDTPVLGSFTELMRRFECLNDESLIRRTRLDILKAIHRKVGGDCEHPLNPHIAKEARAQLDRIFASLATRFRLVVIDFNYDDILDRMRELKWCDGFTENVPDKCCWLFSPAAWDDAVRDESNLLMHLHGSVRYGYRPQETLSDPTVRFAEPARNDSIAGAQVSVAGTDVSVERVDGAVVDASYIISGFRKAGKLAYNARPYGYYYSAVMNLIPKTKHLLVLGYGWRDTHVNTWLNEYVACQPERRTAVVTERLGSQTLEHAESVGNARLAGPAWGAFRSFGYARNPGDLKTASPFKAVAGFALAPEGFVMAQEDESALLSFFIE